MQFSARILALFAAGAFCVAGLHAQTSNVVYGRTTLTFGSSFQQSIAGLATLTDLDGNALQGGALRLSISAGTFVLSTAQGELIHQGGLIASGGGVAVRAQNFVLDSTNLAAPVVTAVLVVNGTYLGRQVLFNVQVPATFTLPLLANNGAVQENNLLFTLAPSASAMLNKAFVANVTAPGELIGTVDVYSVLSASPLTDK